MIDTERLHLRRWRAEDAPAYQRLCADAGMARFLGVPPTLDRARAIVAAQNATLDVTGACYWAVELKRGGAFVGWCGIKPGPLHTPVAGRPEIGWAIDPARRHEGLALEAAAAALASAWGPLGAPAVFAITTPANRASRSLMEALGMRRLADGDFDHPALPPGDPLRRHVTYRIGRP